MATLLQQRTLADRLTDWTQTVAFGQFDPSLGTLTGFGFGLAATISSGIFVESLEAAPSTIIASVDGRANLYGPTGALLASAAAGDIGAADLAAYDGVTDQAGASGTTLRLTGGGASVATYGAAPGDGAAGSFVGAGTVDLTVAEAARVHIQGPANFEASVYTTGSATISLEYQYNEPDSAYTGSPGASGGNAGSDSTAVIITLLPIVSLTTVPQAFSFADRTTGWHDHAAVARFDPAFGQLQSVNLTLSADIVADVGVQNDLGLAAGVTTTQTSLVALGSLLSVAPTVNDSLWLAAGETRSDQGLTQTDTASASLTDASALAAFTGSGTLDLPVSSTGTASLDGPGAMFARLLAESGATVTVSYSYVPAAASWTAGAGGQWTGAANWAVASVPDAAADVSITLGGTYTVTLDTPQTVHSLVLDAPGATLVLGADLHAIGDITIKAGKLVFAGGSLSADRTTISSAATIGADPGAIATLPAAAVVTLGASPGGSVLTLHDLLPAPRLGGSGSLAMLEAAPLIPPRGAADHQPAVGATGANFWDLGWQ